MLILTHRLLSFLALSAIAIYTIYTTDYDNVHSCRQLLSAQSQVYRVTQLCTNGVHRLESAGTGPVLLLKVIVLEVARVTGATYCDTFCIPHVHTVTLLWRVWQKRGAQKLLHGDNGKGRTRYCNYLEDYWPCAGRL